METMEVSHSTSHFMSYNPTLEAQFRSIVSEDAVIRESTVVSASVEVFHEAGIWMPKTQEWIVTSNRLRNKESGKTNVLVSSIDLKGSVRLLQHLSDTIPMGNGGTADGSGGAFLCSQGFDEVAGGIYHTHDYNCSATLVIGEPNTILNSPNDICVYKKKWLLFTDPTYGYEQGFRTNPQNGEWVWCCSKDGKVVTPLIDSGLFKPNGVCLSPDQAILYVTDTAGAGNSCDNNESDEPRHVLAYDIEHCESGDLPIRISNRRVLFEFICDQGVPDGIKVDVDGNIYVGAGDGLRIFSPSGKLIGLIGVDGGVANLCFGGDDLKSLLLLNEKRAVIIRVQRPGVNLQPDFS